MTWCTHRGAGPLPGPPPDGGHVHLQHRDRRQDEGKRNCQWHSVAEFKRRTGKMACFRLQFPSIRLTICFTQIKLLANEKMRYLDYLLFQKKLTTVLKLLVSKTPILDNNSVDFIIYYLLGCPRDLRQGAREQEASRQGQGQGRVHHISF